MDNTEGSNPVMVSKSQKVILSPDWSLQLDFMKLESLVIVDQNATVNTFPGLVHTARHTMGVDPTWNHDPNLSEDGSAYGEVDNWGEVVTR